MSAARRLVAMALAAGLLATAAPGLAQGAGAGLRGQGPAEERLPGPRGPRAGHDNHRGDYRGEHVGRPRGDHRRAREARRAGEAMPLAELLPEIERRHGGRVLGVTLEPGPHLAYRFRLLDGEGRVRDVRIDASDGRAIEAEAE